MWKLIPKTGFCSRKQRRYAILHPKKDSTQLSFQLVDISKPDLDSKIKKFSYSFICGKGYSPLRGENSFLSTV